MKKTLASLLILALLIALPLSLAYAAEEPGELLITSDPVEGNVGDIVKVNFYLYPNLPEGLKLESITCMIKFDPEILKFGTINQFDDKENKESLMKGKASLFQFNEPNPGELKLAFTDGYGVDAEGFWFQAEFRIEKEGATEFVFNGFTYSGIDSSYKSTSFYLEPASYGGVYTPGQALPSDGASTETFAPLSPAVESKEPATATPKTTTPPPTVPIMSALPTYSARPTSSGGIVTPPAPVTATPVPSGSTETAAPATQASETTGTPAAEGTPAPDGTLPAETDLPETSDTPVDSAEPTNVTDETPEPVAPETTPVPAEPGSADEKLSPFAIAGIIAGIVAVIGGGILLIVLVLKRRNR
jgi:hypothetical protein